MMVWKSQLIWNVVILCILKFRCFFVPFLQMSRWSHGSSTNPEATHAPTLFFSADPVMIPWIEKLAEPRFDREVEMETNPFLWTYGCFCVPAGGFSPGDVKRMKGPNNLHRTGPTCEFFPNLVASNRSPVETTERVNNNYYDDHIVIHIEHTVLLGLLYQWICS